MIGEHRYIVEIDYTTFSEYEGFYTLEEAETFMDEMWTLNPKLHKIW